MKTNLLIVEDNRMELEVLRADMEKSGFHCLIAEDGKSALEIMGDTEVDLVLSDLYMPHMDGMELLNKTKKLSNIPFIMLTGTGSVDNAVASIKQGADDYIQKPYNLNELLATIKRSISYYRLSVENKDMKNELCGVYSFENIITNSKAMQKALDKARKVISSPKTTITIYGESGTGKEILARAIHSLGDRVKHRFVAINCAGIPATLLESELFGYVKGSFTGADADRNGKFDLAQGGTLLLDEIGDMPMDLQAKLLRVLEERCYQRVGSNQNIKADFIFIVATHHNLAKMVSQGTFREDLFHRVNAFPITLPPLRERREDIPLLADHFLDLFRKELGKPLPGISKKALDVLIKHSWPGNIRELKNCIEHAAIMTNNELMQPEHLNIEESQTANMPLRDRKEEMPPTIANTVNFNFSLSEEETSLDSIVEKAKTIVLEYCDNNKSRAAKLLKRDRNTFYRKK